MHRKKKKKNRPMRRCLQVQPCHTVLLSLRVASVREKYLENEIFSRSGKSQGILWMAKEI